MLTRDELLAVMPRAVGVADDVVPALDAAMSRFEIDGPVRRAAFLAQLAHESGQLQRWNEDLTYRWQRLRQVFPKYFRSDAEAQAYDRQPERIANRVYGGRMGNGPEASGDGWRYRGRGPIQLTGRDNYRTCGADLGIDLLARPELLETPEVGCLAAAWFWARNGLNSLADAGDFTAITRRVNGGLTALEERRAFWELAKSALRVEVTGGTRGVRGAAPAPPSRPATIRRAAPRKPRARPRPKAGRAAPAPPRARGKRGAASPGRSRAPAPSRSAKARPRVAARTSARPPQSRRGKVTRPPAPRRAARAPGRRRSRPAC